MRILIAIASLALLLVASANAALIDRGGGFIYDTDLDITWLQDANYALTSGYDSDGLMSWDDSMTWVGQLEYGGYSAWRLPSTVDGLYTYGYDGTTTRGYNITNSEMGHLFYTELENIGRFDTDGIQYASWTDWGDGLTNTGHFINVQPRDYWSITEYSADTDNAWSFFFDNGYQDADSKGPLHPHYAWAVHDGDIGTVPIPGAIYLLCSTLLGLIGLRKINNKETSK